MKKLFSLILCLALALCVPLAGCVPNDLNPDGGTSSPPGYTGSYVYSGKVTKAPYTVYNADDSREDEFESMALAIRYAGERATNANKMYVKDANGLLVFQRQALKQSWVYDGTNLVGTMAQADALKWAKEHARSYVLNGFGTAYIYLGADDFTGVRHPEDVYELASGAFSYLFSPTGDMSGDTWLSNGYSYASGTIRLSETTYVDGTELKDNNQWNAYVFFNIRGGYNCDLGIGTFAGGGGKWYMVHNCSHESHQAFDGSNVSLNPDTHQVTSAPSFFVFRELNVTNMTLDPATGVYSGADDLFMECIGGKDTWICRVTNLRTNVRYEYIHTHENFNPQPGYFRVICAASLCPVQGPVWDTRAGGYIKNVIWENVQLARYDATADANGGDYSNVQKDEMYPGLSTVKYGFTQGADCAHLTLGTHATAGQWKSGAAYAAGSRYMSYSSYYDGTHIED